MGPQGPQGDMGPQGSQGDMGPQGNIGVTGPQGIVGSNGTQGRQGPIALAAVKSSLTSTISITSSTSTTALYGLQVTLSAKGNVAYYLVEMSLNIRNTFNPAGGARIGLVWSNSSGGSLDDIYGNYFINTGATTSYAFRSEQISIGLAPSSGTTWPSTAPYASSETNNSSFLPQQTSVLITVGGGGNGSITLNPGIRAAIDGREVQFDYKGSYIKVTDVTTS
jgi:hypothetical protein